MHLTVEVDNHKTAAIVPLLSVSVCGRWLCLSSQLACSLCRLTNDADDLIHGAFVEFYETHTKMTQESSDRHSTDEVAGVGPSSEPQEESLPEEMAAREAEKAEKKRAKKARQRAARAQTAALHQCSQAEVGPDQYHFHMPSDALISIHRIYSNHSFVSTLRLCLGLHH